MTDPHRLADAIDPRLTKKVRAFDTSLQADLIAASDALRALAAPERENGDAMRYSTAPAGVREACPKCSFSPIKFRKHCPNCGLDGPVVDAERSAAPAGVREATAPFESAGLMGAVEETLHETERMRRNLRPTKYRGAPKAEAAGDEGPMR